MAERRMIAKTIVLSDAFIDMPATSRCLYFTLLALADDDGFVNNPKSIMRQIGVSQDDMSVLLSKKFVLGFESGVIVIKHWRIHNYLRNDRYSPTKYQDEMHQLELDENKAYRYTDTLGIPADTSGIPTVSQMDTQYRVGKDSVGRDICSTPPVDGDEFDTFWAAYPRKVAKVQAQKAWLKVDGVSIDEILSALEAQKASKEWQKDGGQYIPYPATWLNQRRWEDEQLIGDNGLDEFTRAVLEGSIR